MTKSANFRIGEKVIKSSARWATNDDGAWPPGVGIGEVVEAPQSSSEFAAVEVRWHESRSTERCEDLVAAASSFALDQLASAWIEAQEQSDHGSPAVQTVIDLSYNDADLCWGFVEAVVKKGMTTEIGGALAAGPVEDLLVYFPTQYFDRVKAAAMTDESFRAALRMVWLDGNDSPLWREFYPMAGVLRLRRHGTAIPTRLGQILKAYTDDLAGTCSGGTKST